MSVGVPMYFLWRLIVIHAPGWRSPGMGRIGGYVKGLIGAQIDWGITSCAVDVHVCVVVLDSLQLSDPGWSTGQVASGSWGTRSVLEDSKVGERFDFESQVEKWVESRKWMMGCWVWVFLKSMVHDTLHTSLLKLFTFPLDLHNKILKSLSSFISQNVTIPVVQWSSISLQFMVRRFVGRKDSSVLVIGVERKLCAKGTHSIEGIQRAKRGQIPHPFPHLIICLLTSRFKGYLCRLFYL